jgi:hypothetical protein
VVRVPAGRAGGLIGRNRQLAGQLARFTAVGVACTAAGGITVYNLAGPMVR